MARTFGAVSLPLLKRAAGVVTRRLPIPQPLLLVGAGAAARLGETIAGFGHRRLLLVTDRVITRLGLAAPLTAALRAAEVDFAVFDAVTPDAPIPMVEEGLALLRAESCDGIVAFGGGSVIDTAKVIGLAAANRKRPRELAGYFRGLHGPMPIYAVPTTAGTGSEVTVAAVISDADAGRKYLVADTRIVPEMAALDPLVMVGLPADVTAATGMDALTHAIEAYVSGWATPHTDRLARAATATIWRQLPRACRDGADLEAREKMALASTWAGLAFTRASVGNVHALAHQLGGRCHVPHGLANAILLPGVLRFALPAAAPRLAQLARHVGLAGADDAALAERFVAGVRELGEGIGIPSTVAALREEDIAALALAACDEADLNYPVPRRMTPADAAALLRAVLPAAQPGAAAEGGAPPDAPPARSGARRPARRSTARKRAAEPPAEG
ncbi:MAG: iron-containing alcohol dehydrogenase [Burkholderiaceae bacterium]|nr:iron-containing alcohol dehydrogenase [Burkholderiaceae bacterium]